MLKEENPAVRSLVELNQLPVPAIDTSGWIGVLPEYARLFPARNAMNTDQRDEYRDIRSEPMFARKCVKTMDFILRHRLPIATATRGYSIVGGLGGMRVGLDLISKDIRLASGSQTRTIASCGALQLFLGGGVASKDHLRALALMYALSDSRALVVQVSSLDSLPEGLFDTVILSEPRCFIEEQEGEEEDDEPPSERPMRLKDLTPGDPLDVVYYIWEK